MALDMTTVARVKSVMGTGAPAGTVATTRDAEIQDLISAVSEMAEDRLGRWSTSEKRTPNEIYRLDPNKRYLSLRGFPIVSVTAIKYAPKRTFDDVDALDAATFDVLKGEGQIYFRPESIPYWFNPGWVEVNYIGGMATDTADFLIKEPRIAAAVTAEVIARLNRAKNPEGRVQAFGTSVAYEKQMSPLEDFLAALAPRRRLRL